MVPKRLDHPEIISLSLRCSCQPAFKLSICSWRTKTCIAASQVIFLADMFTPVRNCSVVVPAIIRVKRIIPCMSSLVFIPWINTETQIDITVIITEEIVSIKRVAEKAELQVAQVNYNTQRIRIPRQSIITPREIYRRV